MSPPTRRHFLRDAGLLGTAAVLPWLPGCDDGSGTGAAGAEVSFRHGVASGDPLSDRVVLWTRVTSTVDLPVRVDWAIGMDPQMRQVMYMGSTVTDADRDYTVKVDPAGLAPGTTYYYQFRARGVDSPIGRTRTLPVGEVDRLRIAYTSCSDYRSGYFNAYRAMARRADLDLVMHLGDYIYEYGGTGIDGRDHAPDHEIVTLGDYRTRYAQYRTDPDLQECHRQHPWVCVWDDHESTNNSYRDGAANHDASEGDWGARKIAATRAYHEWLPIRTPDADDLTRIFREFRLGNLADLIVWETRLFGRDVPSEALNTIVAQDPSRSMMGFEQEDWLAQRLTASTAQWRLYGNQTMFAQLQVLNTLLKNEIVDLSLLDLPANADQWDGYAANRERIYDLWRNRGLRNNIVLTGDIHTSWVSELTPAPGDVTQYGPVTGRGSVGVEFVTPSVTSSGLPEVDPIVDAVRLLNTHIKYVESKSHGYVLLDITRERVQGEFWYVDTIASRDFAERFAVAFSTADAATSATGSNRADRVGTPTEPVADAPAAAPGDGASVAG